MVDLYIKQYSIANFDVLLHNNPYIRTFLNVKFVVNINQLFLDIKNKRLQFHLFLHIHLNCLDKYEYYANLTGTS